MNLFFKHWKPKETDHDMPKLGVDWGLFPFGGQRKSHDYRGFYVRVIGYKHELDFNLIFRGSDAFVKTVPECAEKKIF